MTKKCKKCKKEIDAKAKVCSHCKADQRNWFDRHPIITGVIIIFIILMIIGAVNSGGNVQQQGAPTSIQGHVKEGLHHLGL